MVVSEVYIKECLFRVFPPNPNASEPRHRALELEEDLFNHVRKRLDWSTMQSGSRYSYTELGSPLLEDLRAHDLLDPGGLLALAYWTPEYSPEYSAFGPYFLHTYMPQGHVIDVCDGGSLVPFVALKIALAHLSQRDNKEFQGQDVVLLGFEQNTISRDLKEGLPVPEEASSGALVLSQKLSERCGRLLGAGIFPEAEIFEKTFRLREWVLEVCERYAIDPLQLSVLIPFSGYLAKSDRYLAQQGDRRASEAFEVRFFQGKTTSMQLFSFVYAAMRRDFTRKKAFVLLLEEDVETLALGWALFEGPRVWREDLPRV